MSGAQNINRGCGCGCGHNSPSSMCNTTHDMTKIQCAICDEYGHFTYKCNKLSEMRESLKRTSALKNNNSVAQVNLVYTTPISPIIINTGMTRHMFKQKDQF